MLKCLVRAFGALVVVSLAAFPAARALADDDVVVFSQSSPWNLDYEADSCALRRTFQSGDHSIVLEMRGFDPARAFLDLDYIVVSQDMETRRRFRPSLRFLPHPEEYRVAGRPVSLAGGGKGVI